MAYLAGSNYIKLEHLCKVIGYLLGNTVSRGESGFNTFLGSALSPLARGTGRFVLD